MKENKGPVFEVALLSDTHFGSLNKQKGHKSYRSDANKIYEYKRAIKKLPDSVDIIIITGDITEHATFDEARLAADAIGSAEAKNLRRIAVLGNHDIPSSHDALEEYVEILKNEGGIEIIRDGEVVFYERDGYSLGITGVPGFSDEVKSKVLGYNKRTHKPFYKRADFDRLRAKDRCDSARGLKTLAQAEVDKRIWVSHIPTEPHQTTGPISLGGVIFSHLSELNLIVSGHLHSEPVAGESDLIDMTGTTKVASLHAGLPFRRLII
jgi:predicted MPP superfamily phosphohydrolase